MQCMLGTVITFLNDYDKDKNASFNTEKVYNLFK